MKESTKKRTIFLSHSKYDRDIADSLYNLLRQFIINNKLCERYKVFYSYESLNEDKNSQDWKNAIIRSLKTCSTVVVLWTPHSLNSNWVNYEIGMANAYSKKIVAIGVNGIDYSKFIYNQQVISVECTENILRVLNNIFNTESIDIHKWANDVNISESHNSPIQKLLNNFANRCIYFVGSKQKNWRQKDKWHAEKFVRELSEELLKAKYRLASYPTVDYIGKVVAKTAFEYKKNYEIAGLYKFDEKVGKLATKWTGQIKHWQEIMDRFREVYLKNKHCMIIIGGGEHTKNEYNVASRHKNIQIFPIPCFGGFAEKLFDDLLSTTNLKEFGHPCVSCSRKRGKDWKCKRINDFVTRFREYHLLIENG